MKRKALFFDIDGTLLSEVTRQVPESTKRALAQTKECGHLVFVNTGRSYSELGKMKDMISADGWLCGCGTYVEAEGRILYHRVMPDEQKEYICQLIERCDVDGFLEGYDACYVKSMDSRFPEGQRMRKGLEFCTSTDGWGQNPGPVDKFCILADEHSNRVEFFRDLGLDIHVIDRGNGFYECVPVGHSKATAIDVILEAYGLSLEDAYVFGDSTNDISMFEHVPNAILMGKHSKELEPFASFVTKTVEQDGIWYAVERLGLLDISK